MKTRVSIIIPNLHSPIIDQVLAAVRSQEFDISQVEVLVVGLDGPGLVKTDKLVRFICTGIPVPPAVARNIGAREANGDIFCFLDADCIPHCRWLRTLIGRYEEPDVNVVGGGVAFPLDNYWSLADNIATFYPYLHTARPGTRDQLPSLNLSFRREVWERIGPFDERYPRPAGEDADWTTRARLAGYTLHFEPRAFVIHRSNRTTFRDLWDHAVMFGCYSIKVDERYREVLGLPFVFKYWLFLLLTAPIIAMGVTVRAFWNSSLWRYLHALPAVYVAKLGWCWGASQRLRGRVVWYVNPMENSQISRGGL